MSIKYITQEKLMTYEEYRKIDVPSGQREYLVELEFKKLEVLNEILSVLRGNQEGSSPNPKFTSTSTSFSGGIRAKETVEATEPKVGIDAKLKRKRRKST